MKTNALTILFTLALAGTLLSGTAVAQEMPDDSLADDVLSGNQPILPQGDPPILPDAARNGVGSMSDAPLQDHRPILPQDDPPILPDAASNGI